jgi:hypothetical protein
MVGGPQAQHEAAMANLRRPARHWHRGVWIRFALAIAPTVAFAILGYLQTH